MIKEFKPKPGKEEIFEEISLIHLFKEGQLRKGYNLTKKYNLPFEKYKEHILYGVKGLILKHRASEVLSFVFDHPDVINIDKIEILRKAFDFRDYHGFLKNCLRFKIYSELKTEIDQAINKIRPEEAASWKKKFESIM